MLKSLARFSSGCSVALSCPPASNSRLIAGVRDLGWDMAPGWDVASKEDVCLFAGDEALLESLPESLQKITNVFLFPAAPEGSGFMEAIGEESG